MRNLCFTFHFLQPYSHGRGDGDEPEWPPSPLRMLQALVAASAARWNERQRLDYAAPALTWLVERSPPTIIASDGTLSDTPYRLYVPDNVADKVAKAWAAGREASVADYRTEKDVRPMHLPGGEAVHYLYPLPPEGCPHEQVLTAAARGVTHLGWGVDMVVADARVISQEEADKLPGHRWREVKHGGIPLRVPMPGTLADLIQKHEAFLRRLSADGFRPVPPLRVFRVIQYHSSTARAATAATHALAAFELHHTIEDQEAHPGKSKFRPFHHVRRVATVAGMLRNTAAAVAERIGWDPATIASRVLGHGDGDNGQATSPDRLHFLPLPSITPNGVSGIRRILVVGPPGFDLAPLRRRLNGEELHDLHSKQAVAMLSGIPTTDRNVMPFLEPATTWSTVTPVILPGYDDPAKLRTRRKAPATVEGQTQRLAHLQARTLHLIWKAFLQAGWTSDALAGAEVEYRAVGWFRGLDLARNYDLPPLRFPRYHLRIRFARPVQGPLAVGGGRWRGLGLFAKEA